jgi:hypothetical protein
MGVVMEDLWDHEGYAARRLPDGTLTGTWTLATREFDAYVAACGCGWRGSVDYLPTQTGQAFAIDQWRSEHAEPLLARQATRRREQLASMLGWLSQQRDRLQDPDSLRRVSEGLAWAGELAERLERDHARQAPEREADGGR